ncbi:aspartate/glutamate racemase family protein [Devosia sp. A369]
MTPTESPLGRHRGRPVYGAKLGIIILDTRFQRFVGDIGNAETFDYPVQYSVIKGVSLGADLTPEGETLQVFYRAIDDLVARGVDGISTSCGFLAIMQPHLAARSPVPVASSSLLQIPMLQRMLPTSQQVAVVTAKKPSLTPAHFAGVGVSFDGPIAGMSLEGYFRANLISGNPKIDFARQEQEVLDTVRGLLEENPNIGALVFECTNLSPYSASVEREFGIPVYDVITMLDWFHAGLRPRQYR